MTKVYVFSRADRESYYLKYQDPETGRWKAVTANTKDRRAAERKAQKLETELELGSIQGEVAWPKFRARFEDEHLATLSPLTQKNFGYAMDRFEREIGSPRIRNINASVLSRWKSIMTSQQLSPSTVASYLRCIKTALSWASKIGILSQAPKVIMPTQRGSRGRPITNIEFVRFLQALKEVEPDAETASHLVGIAKTLWLSGLRISEAKELTFDELGGIVVDFKPERPVIRYRKQKNKKQQTVPITPDFARFMSRFRDRPGLVFPIGFATQTIKKRFTAAGRLADVRVSANKMITAHDLRRTFGQRWALRVHPLVLKR